MKKQVILLLALVLQSASVQGAVLDQAQEERSGWTSVGIAGSWYVQTFTCGIGGRLDHVDLWVVGEGEGGTGDPGYPTTVAIVNVADGSPTSSVLAQIDYYIFENGWNAIDFSSHGVLLTSGTQYGIMIANDDVDLGDEPTLNLCTDDDGDPYAGGILWKGMWGDPPRWHADYEYWPQGAPVDACFRTYVGPACVADAGSDQRFSVIPELVVLDGSGSYDLHDYPLTYRWRQVDGPPVVLSDANAVAPTFVPPQLGGYVFELVVNNGLMDSDPDEVLVVVWPIPAGTITVGPGPSYDFNTIQEAIYVASTGDVVVVSPWVYLENISFNGTNITVRSTDPNDAAVVEATIIQGTGTGSVVTFSGDEDESCVLAGFTITGGNATYFGGGVCGRWTRATIRNCIIRNNHAEYGGGGLDNCDGKILNCTISTNSADVGGGLANCDGKILNCTIVGNSVDHNGGGLCSCHGTIRNCNIISNSSVEWGGGTFDCQGRISNCIIWGNRPNNIEYCPLPTYSCIEQLAVGSNISDDPCFVNPDAMDYHLQPESPCINAGDPNLLPEPGESDIDGEPRVLFGRVDIGADEFSGNLRPVADAGPDQSFSDIPALITLDGSGSVDDNGDTLTYHWQQTAGPEVDLDDPNTVGPVFVPPGYGAYVFELVVSDGLLDSPADTVFVVVGSGRVPVADAGLPRYAADQLTVEINGSPVPVNDYVVLDGTGSYDPDSSGPLSYQWKQISGPSVNITGEDTPTPTISGFTQTSEIQRCEFELIVSDGECNSLPDTVEVVIVRAPGAVNNMIFENDSGVFDPDKPTTIYFAGSGDPWSEGDWDDTEWHSLANVISFSEYECEDTPVFREFGFVYARCADMVIAYLSSVAPDYRHQIQVMGGSGGGFPIPSVALNMNRYQDARYAANRLSFFDGAWSYDGLNWRRMGFLASRVDGEPCWIENYVSELAGPLPGALNVYFDIVDHSLAQAWYRETTDPSLTSFNGGVVAGAYWCVFGPGKNLQLAYTPDSYTYEFKWYGTHTSGYMVLDEDCTVCGRLPEPVTLIDPLAGGTIDPNTPVVLTCEESENAVGYELLFGSDPYRVTHYDVISDTPDRPNAVVTTLPSESGYWTIRARDQYGTTIYADPLYIDNFMLSRPVKNLNTGKWYGYIQHAIDDANSGDEIVARPGAYHEKFDFKGKSLRLSSTDPNNPAVVAATIIHGDKRGPAVTFSGGERETCVLSGFTITDGNEGIYCSGANPIITNCSIVGNKDAGIESRYVVGWRRSATVINCTITDNKGSGIMARGRKNPTLTNCLIAGNKKAGIDGDNDQIVTNCTVVENALWGISCYNGIITNCVVRDNSLPQIENDGSDASVTYSNVQGGFSGEGNIDADPCFVERGYWDGNSVWVDGDYHLLADSPCIDAGDPASDWGNEPWPNGSRVNMGAYGNTMEATRSRANFRDLATLAAYWLEDEPFVDIAPEGEGDGLVNFLDFAVLANYWAGKQ